MLEDGNGTPGATNTGVTRREFIATGLAAGAAVALGAALPAATEGSVAQAPAAASMAPGQTLATIGEIGKNGVIKILNENKTYLGASKVPPATTAPQSGQMRYFAGALPDGTEVWPPKNGNPAPGPTIRARVGDTVQITLLNQVDVAAFGNSLDAGETTGSCDVATTVGPTGSVNTYPGDPAFDTMPNCYHGSSTANLHYHGTHVTPNIIGDNVFVQVRPSPRAGGKPVIDEKYLKAYDFDDIFTHCLAGHSPHTWDDLPAKWRKRQERLLLEYDRTAVWQGKKGLPPEEQLWPKNAAQIRAGQWPQFFVGAYPSCFQLPDHDKQPDKQNSMGQAPGTHWYHAHKHGSTALNLANGLAGALIVQGDYDDTLKKYFNKEVVLVLQQYAAQVNLMRAPGTNTGPVVFVNGQYQPKIEMKANEVQLWRIINACHSASVPINGPTNLKWIQTAQDGVQLDRENYYRGLKIAQPTTPTPGPWTNATLTTPMIAPPWFGNLAPGNRVDMLVQAPPSGGTFNVTYGTGTPPTLLMTVTVSDSAIDNPVKFPPMKDDFPPMPDFLKDIDPSKVVVRRDLHFATTPGAGRAATTNAAPAHTINGKKFQDHIIDQSMLLNATEEWTLYNDAVGNAGGPAHPFHIHVNPFQVTEILNPAVSKNPFKLPFPWVWWDNIALPPAKVPPDSTDGKIVSGYVKFLSRFVDYTGAYVLHCHILGHEDRGMMQLVQVISNTTGLGHR